MRIVTHAYARLAQHVFDLKPVGAIGIAGSFCDAGKTQNGLVVMFQVFPSANYKADVSNRGLAKTLAISSLSPACQFTEKLQCSKRLKTWIITASTTCPLT